MLLSDTTIGSKIKVFWREANFHGISAQHEDYSFPATVIWYKKNLREWLLAWTKDQQHPQLHSYPIKQFSDIEVIIPAEFIGGYGMVVSNNVYAELDFFNEKQVCKGCLIPAPHIDTGGKEFVCDFCKVMI